MEVTDYSERAVPPIFFDLHFFGAEGLPCQWGHTGKASGSVRRPKGMREEFRSEPVWGFPQGRANRIGEFE